MNFKLLAVSALIAAGTSTAQAGQFYIDNGVNFAPDTAPPTKVNATSTSLKDEMTVKYQSSTDIFFSNPVAGIQVGDSIITSGGLAVGTLPFNSITSLNPGETLGGTGFADNGFGDDWILSFSFTNLAGTVNGFAGTFPTLNYTSGTIEMLYSLDGTTFNNFMDLEVTSSALTGGANLELRGLVDFTNVDAGFEDLFRLADGTSFYDAWQQVPPLEIVFIVDQNTNPALATVTPFGDDGNGNPEGITITSNHDGSVTFQAVPEPSTVALLGLGLLGFGAKLRKKAA
ncbi:PEP-CTERM sorting domain-containing protein [Methylotuvimicrobium sp. KM1]|uniref:PEP-CTERM sorting domain-containing protein n=1 Tax=Methylotuvimicrobium sp. KM1 TaxID=3377707 RepID=UPI00384BD2E5